MKTTNNTTLPEASSFTEKGNKAQRQRREAEESRRALRKEVADALDDIAMELDDEPLALSVTLSFEVPDEEDFEEEPECNEYTDYLDITGFRYNDYEGVAEVLEDGWEDAPADELSDCAYSIYRLTNTALCELYEAVKRAYDRRNSAE